MFEFLHRVLDMLNEFRRQTSSPIWSSPTASPPMASLERSLAAARSSHASARRALAIAIAEEAREGERRTALIKKTNDLEQRAIEALRVGRDDLASQAAEAIAAMSDDINASEKASQRFAAEITLARREVDAQRRRLANIDRGRRMARIDDAITGSMQSAGPVVDSFSEAETALEKIKEDNQNARAVRHEMSEPAERLIETMAEAGLGQPTHTLASDVMDRLREAAGQSRVVLLESNLKF